MTAIRFVALAFVAVLAFVRMPAGVAAELVDDFSTNTLGAYTQAVFWGSKGSIAWDTVGQRVRVLTADNTARRLARSLPLSAQGSFEIDFLGTQAFPATGVFTIRLIQDTANYYELSSYSGEAGPGHLRKVVGGTEVGFVRLPAEHVQNVLAHFSLSFDSAQATASAFGRTVVLTESTSLLIGKLELDVSQQHAYLDNLRFTSDSSAPPPPPTPAPPVASAGPDQTVAAASLVTLDGTGSRDPDGTVTGYAWTQTGGPVVTLAGAASSRPTFTAPSVPAGAVLAFTLIVTDNQSRASAPDTVQITVQPAGGGTGGGAALLDDFSTNTLGAYTQAVFWGSKGSIAWDSVGQRLRVLTGDNTGRRLARSLPPSTRGSFEIDFLGTQTFPATGVFTIRLIQDSANYYELSSYSGEAGPGHLRKVVGGAEVGFVPLAAEHVQNVLAHFSLNFDNAQATASAFGRTVVLAENTPLSIGKLELDASQQHAYLDNLRFTSDPSTPPPAPPVASAGPDQTVAAASLVTLDGTGSRDPDGTVTGYAWTQTGGPAVTLAGAASSRPTFTAPSVPAGAVLAFTLIVTDNQSRASAPDTVQITVRPAGGGTGGGASFDDFSTNTLSSFSIANTWTDGGLPSVAWNGTAQNLRVLTGDNVGVSLTRTIAAPASSGVFEIDIQPTAKYPPSGTIRLRLAQDAANYYEYAITDGSNTGYLQKVVNGTVVAQATTTRGYFQGPSFDVNIVFSPSQLTVGGLFRPLGISDTANRSITVSQVTIAIEQQDANLDNFAFDTADPVYYVAFGDSITEGVGDTRPDDGHGYPAPLEDLLATSGSNAVVFNEGVSGDKTTDAIARIGAVLARHPAAELILIQLGTNDATVSRASGRGLSPGQAGYAGSYKHNMQRLIDASVAAGVAPVLAKAPPFIPLSNANNALVREYNQVVDELVFQNALAYPAPDFFCYFSANPREFDDGVHPNGTGYASMARIWQSALRGAGEACPR